MNRIIYEWVTSNLDKSRHIWISYITQIRGIVRWWRRPIGCLKLQVIFYQRATNHRALLRKTTYKDKASYGSLPPCTIASNYLNDVWMSHVNNYRALLRKMTYKDKASFATLYNCLKLFEWCVMSHVNGSRHIWMIHVTYICVMAYIKGSCHIWIVHIRYEWVMSNMDGSCHIWMSPITYECVMLPRMNK